MARLAVSRPLNPRGFHCVAAARSLPRLLSVVALLGVPVVASHAQAAPPSPPSSAARVGFAVESYYRIRWGAEEEFLALWRKNHLPFLQTMLASGILLEVRTDTPREHLAEDSRWDLRVTLVYRDAAAAYAEDRVTEAEYMAIVRSDADEVIFKREEQRRFELLLAHWDVNVKQGETFTPK